MYAVIRRHEEQIANDALGLALLHNTMSIYIKDYRMVAIFWYVKLERTDCILFSHNIRIG
jgi:hypothetical protein